MKILLLLLFIGVIYTACTEENVEPFQRTDNYIFFVANNNVRALDSLYNYNNYVGVPSYNKTRDTVYFRIGVGGNLATGPRKFKLEQYDGYGEETISQAAVAGEDYIAFDDPLMVEHYTISADSLEMNIPIIITSTTYTTKVLNFRLVENEEFKLFHKGNQTLGIHCGRIKIN